MSRLDELQRHMRPSGWRTVAFLIIGVIVGIIAWAYLAELEEVAVANGEVVPFGQIKVVQHLEGGIISDLSVLEGDYVSAGDVVMRLNRNRIGSTREEVQIELDGLLLGRARLEAEATGNPLVFDAGAAARRPEIVAAERETYRGHKRQFSATISVLDEQRNQRSLESRELEAQLRSAKDNVALSSEKLAMSADLLEDGLTPKIEHKQLEQEVKALEGQIHELEASVSRAKAGISEAEKRINEEKSDYQQRALDELSGLERRIARAREELSRATDQVVRSEILSPIDGVVKSLRHHTIGGVVRPGEPLMEIVPTQERLVVEARLDPTDIGYVSVGQAATVKVSTYEFTRYGGLEGVVKSISADSHVDPSTGQTFFRVIAETDKTYLGENPGELPIAPGMEATVDIHTGSKSVLDYLLKPVIRAQSESFRER